MPVRLRIAVVIAALVAAVLPAVPAASETTQPRGRVLFPTNALTVRDNSQLTGRRLNFPLPDCTKQPSTCDELRLLNQLDGFDLEPRVAVQLNGRPNLDELERWNFHVERVSGGPRIRMNRFVYDPESKRLFAQPRRQLREGTLYQVVWNGEGERSVERFTTMSATRVLRQMRRQLDTGKAYRDAGLEAGNARRIRFNILPEGGRAVFPVDDIAPTPEGLVRYNHRFKGEPLVKESVIEVPAARAGAKYYAFGFFRSPQWVTRNRFIPHTDTATDAPQVRRFEKVGITLILPDGTPPEGGWPTAIFGPGITRSKYDLFLAADTNASRGIATLSFDPVGHAYGPKGEFEVRTASGTKRFPMFGRARDTNRKGEFDAITNVGVPQQPHRLATVALRDGLRQTAADMMGLVRAIERGVDVDGDKTFDLRRDNVAIYAQSLGGIYGTMVAAVDNRVEVAALNVPGGPIVEIARLAPGFRPNVSYSLGHRQPSLLNGGLDCFTESSPIWGRGPVMKPAEGALKIQDYAARSNWVSRAGSPESFAPLLRFRQPASAPDKRFIYQFAYGDETVPNPTSFLLMRAGYMGDRVSYYRNDKSGTPDTNPHGFLLDPTVGPTVPRTQAQAQIVEFIASNGETVIDPDGPGQEWEVPINPKRTLSYLHYDLRAEVESRDQYDGKGCPTN